MHRSTKYFIKTVVLKSIALTGRLSSCSRKAALIVPPAPNPGGMGDDALLSSLANALIKRGYVSIGVMERKGSSAWQQALDFSERVDEPTTLGDWWGFSRALKAYSHVFVIGADMIDGHYSIKDSIKLLGIADFAAVAGKNTTITGCSFNQSASKAIVRGISALDSDVRLLARDPRSHARLSALGKHRVELVADLAFMLQPDSGDIDTTLAWADLQQQSGRRILGVNLAPIVLGVRSDEAVERCVQAFATALGGIMQNNPSLSVLIIPHDLREGIGDVGMCERLYTALSGGYGPRTFILRESFRARSIKAVAARLHACITCRMHLAIACLGNDVPVGAVVYQDKFEGLFDLFGVAPPLITGDSATDEKTVTDFIETVLAEADTLRAAIARELPRVTRLSESNLPGD